MDDRDRELETTVEDLAETLEDLRAELREPPRGPLGLPRPPTPGEFLRFTEQYTIPALISLLEASIRTLELLAAALRVADGRPLDGDSTVRREAAAGTDRIAAASRRTLSALDEALAELQSAAAGGEPESPELQRLLSEARQLRAEVDDRLAEATTEASRTSTGPDPEPEPVNIEVTGGEDDAEPTDREDRAADDEDVDVDQELESIKREFEESEGADATGEDDAVDEYRERHDAPQDPDSDDEDADDVSDAVGPVDDSEDDRGDDDSVDDTDVGGADGR